VVTPLIVGNLPRREVRLEFELVEILGAFPNDGKTTVAVECIPVRGDASKVVIVATKVPDVHRFHHFDCAQKDEKEEESEASDSRGSQEDEETEHVVASQDDSMTLLTQANPPGRGLAHLHPQLVQHLDLHCELDQTHFFPHLAFAQGPRPPCSR